MEDNRPNPDQLLRDIEKTEGRVGRGKLRIFFGMCPGVGKTYSMLKAAQEQLKSGVDVVVGLVETHQRPDTQVLLKDFRVLPRKK